VEFYENEDGTKRAYCIDCTKRRNQDHLYKYLDIVEDTIKHKCKLDLHISFDELSIRKNRDDYLKYIESIPNIDFVSHCPLELTQRQCLKKRYLREIEDCQTKKCARSVSQFDSEIKGQIKSLLMEDK